MVTADTQAFREPQVILAILEPVDTQAFRERQAIRVIVEFQAPVVFQVTLDTLDTLE